MPSTLQELLQAHEQLLQTANLQIDSWTKEKESSDYYAHTFSIKDQRVRFRIAKKTPKKKGWFVTMWKRDISGQTAPYDARDRVDFFVIGLIDEEYFGLYIFPKALLLEKNIFSKEGRGGKHALRVYAPGQELSSRAALATRRWQTPFYIDLRSKEASEAKLRELYAIT